MKKQFLKIIMVIAVALSFSAADAQFVVKVRPPMPPVVTVRPPRPSPVHVWVGGEYQWNHGNYEYREGHWDRPADRRHGWVEGHWRRGRGGWYWQPGHWR